MRETQRAQLIIDIESMQVGRVLDLDDHHEVCHLTSTKFILTFAGLDVADDDWNSWPHGTAAAAVDQWVARAGSLRALGGQVGRRPCSKVEDEGFEGGRADERLRAAGVRHPGAPRLEPSSRKPSAELVARWSSPGWLTVETRWVKSQDEGHGGLMSVPSNIYACAWARAKRAGNGAGSVLSWLQGLARTGTHGVEWLAKAETSAERAVRVTEEYPGTADGFAAELRSRGVQVVETTIYQSSGAVA